MIFTWINICITKSLLFQQESHGRTISLLSKTDENLSASLMNVTALEKSISAAGEKFIFMQKLRDFVSVICEFLQVRVLFNFLSCMCICLPVKKKERKKERIRPA